MQEHEGKLFECDICDYKAKMVDRLDDHRKGVHEGQLYQCDQCEYNCIFRGPLLQHKKAVHEGVRFACNICDYKATRSGNLQAHVRSVHMNEKRKSKEEFLEIGLLTQVSKFIPNVNIPIFNKSCKNILPITFQVQQCHMFLRFD